MGNCTILLSEKKRMFLVAVCAFLSTKCAVACLGAVVAGAYMQIVIESKTHFLDDFNTAALPALIITVGLYGIAHNVANAILCLKMVGAKNRDLLSTHLFKVVVSGLILPVLVVLLGFVCFIQVLQLGESYEKGILRAMNKYSSDQTMKYALDTLQLSFECCGSNAYSDWFGVQWIDEQYIVQSDDQSRQFDIGHTNSDVPFSCCSPRAKRPCIHHDIQDNDAHFNYDYRMSVTINTLGCKDALTTFYGNGLLQYVGIVLWGLAIMLVVNVMVLRILQTSMASCEPSDDGPPGPSYGYLFASKSNADVSGEGKPLVKEVPVDEEVGNVSDGLTSSTPTQSRIVETEVSATGQGQCSEIQNWRRKLSSIK